jgi:two-component system, NarL family, response regulator DesR
MIRVLIAEDQGMVRGALAALLDIETDLEVVGQAASGPRPWRLRISCGPTCS